MILRLSAFSLLALLLVGCSGGSSTPTSGSPGGGKSAGPSVELKAFAAAPVMDTSDTATPYVAPGRSQAAADGTQITYTALSGTSLTYPATWTLEEDYNAIRLIEPDDRAAVNVLVFHADPKVPFSDFQKQMVQQFPGVWQMPKWKDTMVGGIPGMSMKLVPLAGEGDRQWTLYAAHAGVFYHAILVRSMLDNPYDPAVLDAIIASTTLSAAVPASAPASTTESVEPDPQVEYINTSDQ